MFGTLCARADGTHIILDRQQFIIDGGMYRYMTRASNGIHLSLSAPHSRLLLQQTVSMRKGTLRVHPRCYRKEQRRASSVPTAKL